MARFALFVDGSNLYGSLRGMDLDVTDYEALFGYIYDEARTAWHLTTRQSELAHSQLQRTYWYHVGSIDDWDLSNFQSHLVLKDAFMRDREIHDVWVAKVLRENPELNGGLVEEIAWSRCFEDLREWYERKRSALDGLHRFFQGVRNTANLIEVLEVGHWKVNFIRKWVEEKGLDTALAVDMVALQDNYDVALVVSGDADSIPSIRHLKTRGKHIAAVELVNGSGEEAKGRSFSSRLKQHVDFVIRIYESDLLQLKLGTRMSARYNRSVENSGEAVK